MKKIKENKRKILLLIIILILLILVGKNNLPLNDSVADDNTSLVINTSDYISESIVCVFNGSQSVQSCASRAGSCSGVGSCLVRNVRGREGNKVPWESDCSDEIIRTRFDGTRERVNFSCKNEKEQIEINSSNNEEETISSESNEDTHYTNTNNAYIPKDSSESNDNEDTNNAYIPKDVNSINIEADSNINQDILVYNVVSLGVDNTGREDVTKKVQDILDLLDSSSEQKTIFFPKGKYKFECNNINSKQCLEIKNVNNINLVFDKDSEIIISRHDIGLLYVSNSNNIKISGLNVDYSDLPFTQGKIVSKYKNGSQYYVDIKLDNGFDSPLDTKFKQADSTPIIISNGVTPKFYQYIYPSENGIKKKRNVYTIQLEYIESRFDSINTGDSIAILARNPSPLLSFRKNSNLEIRKITVYTSPTLVLHVSGYEGNPLIVDNLNITRKNNRIISSVGGATNFINLRSPVYFTNSRVLSSGDDAFNVHSGHNYVQGVSNQRTFKTENYWENAYKIRDNLQIIDANNLSIKGTSRIEKITRNGNVFFITLTDPIPNLTNGDLVFNFANSGLGSKVSNNIFGPFRGYFRIYGMGTEFTNNEIQSPLNQKILFGPVTNFTEGPMISPNSLTIFNNVFSTSDKYMYLYSGATDQIEPNYLILDKKVLNQYRSQN